MHPQVLVPFRVLLFSAFFLIPCFCLVGQRLAFAASPSMEDCEPKSCGDGTGLHIAYPFWLSGQQPSYCGYPPFELSCEGADPVLGIQGQEYHILDIFYQNRSFLLAEPDAAADGDCPIPSGNLSIGGLTPYSISTANRMLLFLFNCSQPPPPADYVKTPCEVDGTTAYFGGEYTGQPSSIAAACETLVAPRAAEVVGSSSDYVGLLRSGVLLNWTAPDCSECSRSGGRCGYNDITAEFMCICPDRPHVGHCRSDNRKNKRLIIGFTTAAGGLILGCTLSFFLYRFKKRRQRSSSSMSFMQSSSSEPISKDPELGSSQYQTHLFSYDELEEATNCFDSSRELGDGGFGTVYKGKLRDGRMVAVKRLYENNYKRVEQFMNEVVILSRLSHPNLVNLYGCTSRHSRELLLVYEFVPNGTVADHLHGPRANEGALAWPIRLRIAIETADALTYLHAVEPPIIHRDVKTNNILLDRSFHVKVGDFGLSRLFPTDATHVSTAPQGTPGYVDPEYHKCYQLSNKSDVYSFGVVLVELISSKPAVDITRDRSEINLANMAMNKIQNRGLDQLVDPRLGYHSDGKIKKMIKMVAELAFRCLQSDGDVRPPIKEVFEVLRGIESRGYGAEEEMEADVSKQDKAGLPNAILPFSPDSVTDQWVSRSTTPNTSE